MHFQAVATCSLGKSLFYQPQTLLKLEALAARTTILMSQEGAALVYSADAESHIKWVIKHSPKLPLNEGDVLIKVHAAGLNPIDFKIPKISLLWSSRKNTVAGMDVAGTVVAVGSKVRGLAVGDLVFGCGFGLAEYTVVPATGIAKAPAGVEDIAPYGALGVAAGTAYQMLEIGKAFVGSQPKNVLVIGASGGVGTFAVQIAKAKCPAGSTVTAVCSESSSSFVRALGADEIVTYNTPNFMQSLPQKSFDVVIDAVSSPEDYNYVPEGLKLLKDKAGEYVAANTARPLEFVWAGIKKLFPFNLFPGGHYHVMFLRAKTEDFEAIGELVRSGQVRIPVQEYLPFSEEGVQRGLAALQGRRVRGKLVVKME